MRSKSKKFLAGGECHEASNHKITLPVFPTPRDDAMAAGVVAKRDPDCVERSKPLAHPHEIEAAIERKIMNDVVFLSTMLAALIYLTVWNLYHS
jgi:hypothetical protein